MHGPASPAAPTPRHNPACLSTPANVAALVLHDTAAIELVFKLSTSKPIKFYIAKYSALYFHLLIFGMAAMTFPFNGILLIQDNLLRVI